MSELLTETVASVIGATVGAFLGRLLVPVDPKSGSSGRGSVWRVLSLGVVIGGIMGYLVAHFIIPAMTVCKPKVPEEVAIVDQYRVSVPADQYWFNTGIIVEKGDWLHSTAEGRWWSGISETGPNGDKGGLFGIGRPSCGGCPAVDGNLGELIGKVEGEFPFRIGKCQTEFIRTDGALLLAMNETTGPCKDGRAGSCYEDNHGSLRVTVTVFRTQ